MLPDQRKDNRFLKNMHIAIYFPYVPSSLTMDSNAKN